MTRNDRRRKVAIVEIPIYDNVVPLVGGYLSLYARQDPVINQSHEFVIVNSHVDVPSDSIVSQLVEVEADVYGVSCYGWNGNLVRRVVTKLASARPDAWILLGGPQVMHNAPNYAPPGADRVVVCNGEGEQTFQHFVRETWRDDSDVDLSRVPGITFRSSGNWTTTDSPGRIQNLMDVPSPFTAGLFDDRKYGVALLETNRGCPFKCSFCYWGAATNDRVRKFELERVKADISWISTHSILSLYIVDANFGMVPQDLDIARYIVECKAVTGFPLMMSFSTAKNRPSRVMEIVDLLTQGGIVTTQAISLQTLSDEALQLVDRQNIKTEAYIEIQQAVRQREISSWVEVMWPLPGETLTSFKEGVQSLCRRGAEHICVYPHLLLQNTPMQSRVDDHGLEIHRVDDEIAEVDVVVATKWVRRDECEEGHRYAHALHIAHNVRAAFVLTGYLDRSGACSYSSFLSGLAAYLVDHPEDCIVGDFIKRSVASFANYDLLNVGTLTHLVLHQAREEFEDLLLSYCSSAPWWQDPMARAAVAMDMALKPYVYREPLRTLRWNDPRFGRDVEWSLIETTTRAHIIQVAPRVASLLAGMDLLVGPHEVQGPQILQVDHSGRPGVMRLPYMPGQSLQHNAQYCHAMVQRVRDIMPTIKDVTATMSAVSG